MGQCCKIAELCNVAFSLKLLLTIVLLSLSQALLADYVPGDLKVWDGWTVIADGKAHLYYLQYRGPGSVSPAGSEDYLGHAVSEDLLSWRELPGCLGPGKQGGPDDMQPWTGCTVYKDGSYYLFYTMRSTADGARGQKIGLAISRDGQNFRRYEHNPVIVPDDRWYISDLSVCNSVDCRDMTIVKYGDRYIGYFVTRRKGSTLVDTNCIACAESYDLINWKQLPPVFTSSEYSCTECPDVFCLNGRWFMTLATGNRYGSIAGFTDKNIISGVIYASSDSPFGPFREYGNNVLIGEGGCFRSFEYKGERYGIFCAGTASRPFAVKAKNKSLWLEFPAKLVKAGEKPAAEKPRLLFPHSAWRLAEGEWTEKRGVYYGSCPKGYSACQAARVSGCWDITCCIRLKGAGGGLVIRPDIDSDTSLGDTCIYIDRKAATIQISSMADMAHNTWNTRSISLKGGEAVLRAVRYEDKIDVYVNGALMLHVTWLLPEAETNGIGFVTDRGRVEAELL